MPANGQALLGDAPAYISSGDEARRFGRHGAASAASSDRTAGPELHGRRPDGCATRNAPPGPRSSARRRSAGVGTPPTESSIASPRWATSQSTRSARRSTRRHRAQGYVEAVSDQSRAADREFLGLVVDGSGFDGGIEITYKLMSPRGSFYGGAGLALACAMMEQATGRDAVWCTVQFASSAAHGDHLQLHSEVVAHGHRTSQVRVSAAGRRTRGCSPPSAQPVLRRVAPRGPSRRCRP